VTPSVNKQSQVKSSNSLVKVMHVVFFTFSWLWQSCNSRVSVKW